MIQSDNVLGFISDCFAKRQGQWCFMGHQQGDEGFRHYVCVPSLQSALNAIEVHDLAGYLREGKTEHDLALDAIRCYSFITAFGPNKHRSGENEAASLFGHAADKNLAASYGVCQLTDEHQDTALACWEALMPSTGHETYYSMPDVPNFAQMSFGDWDFGEHEHVVNTAGYSYNPVSYRAQRPRKKPRNAKNVVRDASGECYEVVHSKAWGTTLIPCLDPDGADITEEDREGLKQIPDFPRIPAQLWQRWLSLCFEFCPPKSKTFNPKSWQDDRSLEVSCLLLRNEGDMRTWKILVPKQVVGGGSVQADFTQTVDIETGEEHSVFPPVGWLHAGSSHSHNTMNAFFSGTDDKFELGVPGLHVVVGKISHENMSYDHAASVVLRETRKLVDGEAYVDLDPDNAGDDVNFHASVLKIISKVAAPAKTTPKGKDKPKAKSKSKSKAKSKSKGKPKGKSKKNKQKP